MVAVAIPLGGFAGLNTSATQELAKHKIPAASIAVVRGDRIVYSKVFGTANLETGEPMRPEMLVRIGSTTKMFTAAALVGLAVEGKIDLNAPVGTHLKFLPHRLSQATANQLLSHAAGIHDEAPHYGSHDDSALGSGIRAWIDGWLFISPGSIVSYSNPGYWLAGFLLQTLAGTRQLKCWTNAHRDEVESGIRRQRLSRCSRPHSCQASCEGGAHAHRQCAFA